MNRFSILLIVIPNLIFFITALFFMRVTEIVEITPNITKVILLLLVFNWTRFMQDFQLYKGNLKCDYQKCDYSTDAEQSDPAKHRGHKNVVLILKSL